MDNETIQKMIRFKKTLEEQEKKKLRLEGKIDQVLSQLKELNCTSVEEARRQIEVIRKKIQKYSEELEIKSNDWCDRWGSL